MSNIEVSMSLDTAVLMGIERLRMGDPESARQLCESVLGARPEHGQAAILALWLAIRSGDRGAIEQAAARVGRSASVLGVVPRLPPLDPGPALADPLLGAAFNGAVPPASDISDHLGTLFYETVAQRPRLIVELGTRGGESTRALLAAAEHTHAQMLSLDIEPCEVPDLPANLRQRWHFVQSDDVAFGRDRFDGWCRERRLPPEAPVLFIDTSHEYEHTKAELQTWLPKVPPGGVAMFHDTCMDHAVFRNDGSIVFGWDNHRGVIRAIEEALDHRIDERAYMVARVGAWLIRHDPKSNGFTVLRNVSPQAK